MSRRLYQLLCLVFLVTGLMPARAIIIDSFTTETNDRFANDGSFVLNGFDLSGLGFSSDGKWATLISDNVFISANHFHPGLGATVTFYATNDPNGASIIRTVSSGQRIGSSDLWVGVLDSPVTSDYTNYTFLTADIADATAFNSSAVHNAIGYMVGRSATSWANPLNDVAVGTNVVDVWVENANAAGVTDDALTAVYRLGVNDLTYEALVETGDSGAPLFVSNGSSLFIAGVNWWVGSANITVNSVTSSYDLSGFSYVGNYDASISSFITANAVPEPSASAALLGAFTLGFIAIRRRRRAP